MSCKKGSECESDHPKVCQKLLEKGPRDPGGCTGKDCHDLHPPICNGAIKYKRCVKINFEYFHMKSTRRRKTTMTKEGNDDNGKSSKGKQNKQIPCCCDW